MTYVQTVSVHVGSTLGTLRVQDTVKLVAALNVNNLGGNQRCYVTLPPPLSSKQKREVKLRSMFVAPPDHVLLSWDLKQAESWTSAYFAQERTMIHELKTGDIHALTASTIFHEPKEVVKKDKKKRYVGKQSNHMYTYRASAFRYTQTVNKESDGLVTLSHREGAEHYKAWHSLYHFERWWEEIEALLESNMRTLVTPYGRIRTFFERWGIELFKQATAHLSQSTVGDHTNGAIQPELGIPGGVKEVYNKYVKTGAIRLVNQSHDSILAEVPNGLVSEVAAGVKSLMERPLVIKGEQFTIPVEVEVGKRWGELEELKL